MGISGKNKKRVLIFLLIPILIVVLFVTNDVMIRIISASVLIIYAAFIIFLRDSVRTDLFFDRDEEKLPAEPLSAPKLSSNIDFDPDEDFKIISSNKEIEIATSETLAAPGSTGKKIIFKPADFKENFERIVQDELPENIGHDGQFVYTLDRILRVLKDAFIAHTAFYFWYNSSKRKLTLEKYVSSSKNIKSQKFEIEDDILSKIILTEEPELLSNITPNAEADIIRYYDKTQGIRSFVGVPLYHKKTLVGILGLDSKDGDAFGIETIYSLGRFSRVISILISFFEEKFSEAQAQTKLNSLLQIFKHDHKFKSEEDLYNTIESTVKSLLPWDVFSFVAFNPKEQKFKTARIVNKTSLKYVGEFLEVELTGTVVGESIIKGIPINIHDTSEKEFKRFAKNEDVSFDGSFLTIPLLYENKNYGLLCFESLKKNMYTESDVKFIVDATRFFAFILYSYSSQLVLRELLSVDIDTRTLNSAAFNERLSGDLVKASEMKASGALALIKIDEFLEQESLFEGNPFPVVLKAVSAMIMEEMTPLNLIGRISNRVFGIYFFNSTTKDVYLWAEKLRVKIARKMIPVVSKQTAFTISVGIASTNNKIDVDEALSDASLALNKAIEKGGNSVNRIN
ncbi:MAG: GAF domain-containing protein [Bacteroidetes bacterium]|nr:GAF domain-containing protein [Bacteroidota bacterium]